MASASAAAEANKALFLEKVTSKMIMMLIMIMIPKMIMMLIMIMITRMIMMLIIIMTSKMIMTPRMIMMLIMIMMMDDNDGCDDDKSYDVNV